MPNWKLQLARETFGGKMKNQIAQAPKTTNPVGRPLTDGVAATGHIHLRVTLARKGWYVRTARLYNQTLAEWMQQECDKSSSYPPKGQNERV
jgi:hypothetical protein